MAAALKHAARATLSVKAELSAPRSQYRTRLPQIAARYSAQAAPGPDASSPLPPHEALLRAWKVLSATAHTRFRWSLDAVLDEEDEADEWEDGDDAPVVVETGYPYTL